MCHSRIAALISALLLGPIVISPTFRSGCSSSFRASEEVSPSPNRELVNFTAPLYLRLA